MAVTPVVLQSQSVKHSTVLFLTPLFTDMQHSNFRPRVPDIAVFPHIKLYRMLLFDMRTKLNMF